MFCFFKESFLACMFVHVPSNISFYNAIIFWSIFQNISVTADHEYISLIVYTIPYSFRWLWYPRIIVVVLFDMVNTTDKCSRGGTDFFTWHEYTGFWFGSYCVIVRFMCRLWRIICLFIFWTTCMLMFRFFSTFLFVTLQSHIKGIR